MALRNVSKLLSTYEVLITILTYQLWELINTVVECCEVGEDRGWECILQFSNFFERPGFRLLHQLVKFGSIDWKMAFDDLEPFV